MGFLDFIFGSDDEPENEPITVDVRDYSWTPDADEKILIAHEKCQILTDDGKATASFQYFICCVTNKRVVLIPMSKKANRHAVRLVASLLDVGFVGGRCLTKEFCDKYVDSPIYIDNRDITKLELYEEIPSFRIVLIKTSSFRMLLGVPDPGYAMDIVAGYHNPHIFM